MLPDRMSTGTTDPSAIASAQIGSGETRADRYHPITAPCPDGAIWQLSMPRMRFSVSRPADGARRSRP